MILRAKTGGNSKGNIFWARYLGSTISMPGERLEKKKEVSGGLFSRGAGKLAKNKRRQEKKRLHVKTTHREEKKKGEARKETFVLEGVEEREQRIRGYKSSCQKGGF